MQSTVRSYLTAGTVAVVGAGAIALTPVVASAPLPAAVPAPAVAEVALTGLSLTLTDVLGLLDGLGIGGVVPDFLTSLPSLLPTDIVSAVVAEFVNQASPLVLAAAGEVFDYLGAAIAGLISGPDSIPVRFGDALAAIPATLVSAVESLGSGDLATAVQTITDALSGPAAGITAVLTEVGQDLQVFLTAEFSGLVGALPGVLLAAVQTVITDNVQSLIDTITGALAGLTGGLVPGSAAAVAAVTPAGTVGCDTPAIRSATGADAVALPAANAVPVTPSAAATVQAAVETAAPAVSTPTRARPSDAASRSRGAVTQAAPAQAVSGAESAESARPSDSRAAAGKADAGRGTRSATR